MHLRVEPVDSKHIRISGIHPVLLDSLHALPEIFEQRDSPVARQRLLPNPTEVSFRSLTTHIMARDLTEPLVREALTSGHAYVAHDWLCDPTGFMFGAVNNLGVFSMGDPPRPPSARLRGDRGRPL